MAKKVKNSVTAKPVRKPQDARVKLRTTRPAVARPSGAFVGDRGHGRVGRDPLGVLKGGDRAALGPKLKNETQREDNFLLEIQQLLMVTPGKLLDHIEAEHVQRRLRSAHHVDPIPDFEKLGMTVVNEQDAAKTKQLMTEMLATIQREVVLTREFGFILGAVAKCCRELK